MGAHTTGEAFVIPGLSDRARLVLVCMAHHSHDTGTAETPRRIYRGGWNRLAWEALGMWGVDVNDPKTPRDWAAKRALSRAIRELVDAGLVKVDTRTRKAVRGNRDGVSYRVLW